MSDIKPSFGISLIPVLRDQSLPFFVSQDKVAPSIVNIEGELIPTGPLLFNKKLDLLGISNFEPLLNIGVLDNTDCIAPGVTLKEIYLEVNKAVVKVSTEELPLSKMIYNVQSGYNSSTLDFHSKINLSDSHVEVISGSLELTNDENIYVTVHVAAKLNLQTGLLEPFIAIDEARIANATEYKEITVTPLGYVLDACRYNPNRRPRAQPSIGINKF